VLWQDDVLLNKNFTIRDGMIVNLRAEAFNLFNRAQLANPGSNIRRRRFRCSDIDGE
jgi:hypothetical protein